MAKARTAESVAGPPTEPARCGCPGCGALAVATTAGDPSAEPHEMDKSYAEETYGRGASLFLQKHEFAHGPIHHCEHHRQWIGTRDAKIAAANKGV